MFSSEPQNQSMYIYILGHMVTSLLLRDTRNARA